MASCKYYIKFEQNKFILTNQITSLCANIYLPIKIVLFKRTKVIKNKAKTINFQI